MSLAYLFVLLVQGLIVPVLWAVYWKRVRPHLRFFAWSTPLALAVGFAWDYLMGLADVWRWLDTSGLWVGILPAEDLLFIVEIYLIPATLVLVQHAPRQDDCPETL